MPNLQNFLGDSDQADLLHRGLQGLCWKLDACALWKKSIPVAQDLLVTDLELCLPAWILYPGQFLWREPEKNLSSPEKIGFHSVVTVWFSFHWQVRQVSELPLNSFFISATLLSFKQRLDYFIWWWVGWWRDGFLVASWLVTWWFSVASWLVGKLPGGEMTGYCDKGLRQ